MAGKRDDCRHSLHIWLVIVSNNRLRRDFRACNGLAEKRFRTGPIPFVPQEHIDNLPVLIDRAIQIKFLRPAKAEHFVDGPSPSDSPSMRTERSGQLWAERLHPVQHRAGGDINVTLS
jgi:hypothetical protein